MTKKRYIGSRYKYSIKGSGNGNIVLLFGRLRQDGKGYDFIGETYVHGIMDGGGGGLVKCEEKYLMTPLLLNRCWMNTHLQ